MDTSVPAPSEWSLGTTDLTVWSLGHTASGPATALVAPAGWVRLSLPAADDDVPLDWPDARARLDDELAGLPTPPDGWHIATVTEAEREVVEFGPLTPAPESRVTQGQLTNAQVYSVDARSELIGWLVADLDSMDATLILPEGYAADPAWRAAARQASLNLLNHLPSRARWRLRIVAEEQVDPDQQPLPIAGSATLQPDATDTSPSPGPRGESQGGAAVTRSRIPILPIVLILALCIVLAFAINVLRQRAAGSDVPALSVPPVTLVPPKAGGPAIVTATRLTPLRRDPNPQAQVILLVAEGQTMTIVEGPRTESGATWWRVQVGQQTGWLPETLPDGTKVLSGRQ